MKTNTDQLKTRPIYTDEALICAVRAGGSAGENAVMEIYAAHHAIVKIWIQKWIQHHGSGRSDAVDIAHDSFLLMIQKMRHGIEFEGHITTFWFGIAKNLWLNQYKKASRMILVKDVEEYYEVDHDTPERKLLIREEFREAEKLFNRMGHKCRDVLLLWIQHYTMEEIAERLHLSGSMMARKIKYECFKKVKKLLKYYNVFES